jgi:hypothetical protein
MDPGLVATMRLLEAEASIDARVIVDGYEAVFEKFWETTKGLMGSCLPKFLSDAFAGHILSDKYGGSQSHMVMNHLDQETIVAIDKHIREQQ